MKKSVVLLLMLLCSVTVLFADGKKNKEQVVYVSVENGILKEKPSRFGKTVSTLDYGEKLTVLDTDGDWYEVINQSDGSRGWVAASSVTKRKIVVGHVASADADEIALAGKGFSQEVEDIYSQSGEGNYEALAQVESLSVSDDDVYVFLVDGNLEQGD